MDRLEEEQPHDQGCQWSTKRIPCRRFSMDGTRLGAMIAHTMGTTDEDDIIRAARRFGPESSMGQIDGPKLSGMDEEQADWEEGLDEE